MWHKSGAITDLLYLALIVSVIRPDQHSHDLVMPDQFHSLSSGSSIDDLGPTSAVQLYLSNLRNSHDLDSSIYAGAKSHILLEETLDVLRDVNSLGRYSRDSRGVYDSHLFAYLVNGDEQHGEEEESLAVSTISSSSISGNSGNTNIPSPLPSSSSLLSPLELITSPSSSPVQSPLASQSSTEETSLISDIEGLLDVDDPFVNEVFNAQINDHETDAGFEENNFDLDDLINNDLRLVDNNDPMLPRLSQDQDDVDSLFDELERFLGVQDFHDPLANSDSTFNDGWQEAVFQNGANNALLPFESNENNPSVIYFDNGGNPHINADNVASSASVGDMTYGLTSSNDHTNNNIGTAMVATMATLTNGSGDPLPEVGASATVYGEGHEGSEYNDLIYLSNASTNVNPNHTVNSGSGEYLLTDLLSDEDLQLMEMTSTNGSMQSLSGNHSSLPHHYYHHQYNSHRSHNDHNQSVNCNITEDRMDASSDSAVSSMSSDRVHSFSDADWIDSCSETSSHHEAMHEHYNNSNHNRNSLHSRQQQAQKKYKLFGKRTDNNREDVVGYNNYYANMSQEMSGNNSSTFSNYSNGDVNSYSHEMSVQQQQQQQQHQAMNYYNPSIHNHTYYQASDVDSLNPIDHHASSGSSLPLPSSSTYQHASLSESRTYSERSFKRTGSESGCDDYYSEEYQLNRDEKRAKAMNIPITIEDIINLPIDEFNERLAKYELTEAQLSLIRDIRRRGKNKVAAQNCRKRKLDQIMGLQSEVGGMFSQKDSLKAQHDHLVLLRQIARDKYAKLYQFILDASSQNDNGISISTNCPGATDYAQCDDLVGTEQQQQQHLENVHHNHNNESYGLSGMSISLNSTSVIPIPSSVTSTSHSNFHENIKPEKHE